MRSGVLLTEMGPSLFLATLHRLAVPISLSMRLSMRLGPRPHPCRLLGPRPHPCRLLSLRLVPLHGLPCLTTTTSLLRFPFPNRFPSLGLLPRPELKRSSMEEIGALEGSNRS